MMAATLNLLPRDFKSLVSRPIAQWQTRHNRSGVERFELPTRKLHPQSSTHKHSRFRLKARINTTALSPKGLEPLWVGVAGMKTRCYPQKPVDTYTYPRINTSNSLRINTSKFRVIHALTLATLRINTSKVVALAQSSKRLQRCSCSYFLYLLFLYKDYLYCFANKGDN